jgi:Reverse transcriptase (RNA-dependent DNA polymerase)
MIIVRYADDVVVGFEHETDARRFWDAMRERLKEFSLSLHPDKARLIEFGRFAADRRAQRGLGKPETFKFLGFVFICGRTRKGKFQPERKSRRESHAGKAQRDQGGAMANAPGDPRTGALAGAGLGATLLTMPCRPTSRCSAPFVTMSNASGCERCGAAVRRIASRGSE